MTRGRLLRGGGLFLAIVALVGVAGLWYASLDRRLTSRATRLTDVSKWDLLQTTDNGRGSYYWLSNHEALNLRGVRYNATQNGPSAFLLEKLGSPVLVRYDVQTGKETRMDQATKLFSQGDADLHPSPDGRRLLGNENGKGILVLTLDGLQCRRFPEKSVDVDGDVYWFPDSRRWLHFLWDEATGQFTQAHIHDMDHPSSVLTLPVSPSSPINASYPGITLVRADLLFTDRSRTSINRIYGASKLTFEECEIKAGFRSLRKRIISFPNEYTIDDYVISPQRDRIAWKLHHSQVNPLEKMLHRLFAAYPVHPQRTVGIWTTDLQGRGLHEVGHEKSAPNPRRPEEALGPEDVQWLPDGKRLSFLYHKALWIVPADE